jgi:eukaryotic-like serine/threonine-protein kinase
MQPLADTGRVIAGRYRLQAPIGRGAMGVVWRARDQLLDRDVAVKEVKIAETLSDEERAHAYQRTLREAKTAARLNHPAVVTVYDVAEDGGRPWIVMQLVNAQSLDQVLASSGPLSPRRAAEVGRQLLSALSVAHTAGVMHRDVKPSNVLLGHDDRAVLTDFGIATFQGDPKLTQTGMVMGSPGFTAPERIRGEDASPASDLWSLGATLYAAVEGHGPFEKRGGAITTMAAIINEDAPEAPTAGALGPVIAALLRREPADRPDAAGAARMITDVLPTLADRAPDVPGGYVPTAISVSPRPGAVRPRTPQPGESSTDSRSADAADNSPAATGPPGGQPTPEQAAPTTATPAAGSSSGYSPGSSFGYAAGSGAGYEAKARPESPPPDFSSWYDPAPRSGATAQAGYEAARAEYRSQSEYQSPAGYQPQPGYHPQPGYGPAQPGSGSAPGGGYQPPRRQSSGLWWKIAVAVLALIGVGAGVATVLLLHHNNAATPLTGGTATSSSPATTTPTAPAPAGSPAQIIVAVNQAAGTLPAGYATYSQPAASNEKAGFSLAAPTSWKVSARSYQTYLKDPSNANVNILVDLTPHTYSDMLQEATYIESQSMPRFPGYQRVDLARTTIRGQPGAFWKFTWNDQGVQQEAIDLLYVAQTSAGPQSYALYMTAPESMWNDADLKTIFDEEVRSFSPVTLPG